MTMRRDWKKLGIRMAKRAGKKIRRNIRKKKQVIEKKQGDIKVEMDRKVEKELLDMIQDSGGNFSVLTEERGKLGDSELIWVIDPIDGTVNYNYQIPFLSTSIALEKEGSLLLGIIYDPLRDEIFLAEKGKGSFLNGEPMQASERTVKDAVVEITHFRKKESLDILYKLASKVNKFRKLGSAALSIAYVASGRLDAYLTLHSFPWDVAAGILIIKEAGGKVTNLNGKKPKIREDGFLFSNGVIHEALLEFN